MDHPAHQAIFEKKTNQGPQSKEQTAGYTYGDYKTWSDDERWELIDGVAWNMSPAPSPGHQTILLGLLRKIADITDRTGCTTFVAPFDVRLPDNPTQSEDDTPTVVQPDISVFCDPSRLDDKGAHAAPDLVVEILSPFHRTFRTLPSLSYCK